MQTDATTTYTADQIAHLGNEWTKGGHHRIYLDIPLEDLGIEHTANRAGRVKYAYLDGDSWDAAAAQDIKWGKVYWDADGQIHIQGHRQDVTDEIAQRIYTWIAERATTPEADDSTETDEAPARPLTDHMATALQAGATVLRISRANAIEAGVIASATARGLIRRGLAHITATGQLAITA